MMNLFLAAALTCAAVTSAMAIELPPELAKQGSIKVAIVPNYPPMEFRDPATNTLTGFDVELGEALGKKLGIKIDWQQTSFDQMMPAISTGRVDAILSGMTDMASRQDTATLSTTFAMGPDFSCSNRAPPSSRTRRHFAGKRSAPAGARLSEADRYLERGPLRR
jgi:ABC-type amino acid transport/signal transduction systems, periplasmic component/domain